MEIDDKKPEEQKRALVTEILKGLQTLHKLDVEHDEALHLHQELFEAWGKRIVALERQMAEVLRVLQAPARPGNPSVN